MESKREFCLDTSIGLLVSTDKMFDSSFIMGEIVHMALNLSLRPSVNTTTYSISSSGIIYYHKVSFVSPTFISKRPHPAVPYVNQI